LSNPKCWIHPRRKQGWSAAPADFYLPIVLWGSNLGDLSFHSTSGGHFCNWIACSNQEIFVVVGELPFRDCPDKSSR
jgi:hypothetical protein